MQSPVLVGLLAAALGQPGPAGASRGHPGPIGADVASSQPLQAWMLQIRRPFWASVRTAGYGAQVWKSREVGEKAGQGSGRGEGLSAGDPEERCSCYTWTPHRDSGRSRPSPHGSGGGESVWAPTGRAWLSVLHAPRQCAPCSCSFSCDYLGGLLCAGFPLVGRGCVLPVDPAQARWDPKSPLTNTHFLWGETLAWRLCGPGLLCVHQNGIPGT